MDSSPTHPRLAEARLAAVAAAVAGDAGTLYRLVAKLMDEGVPFETVLFDLLTRTEQDVGTRWERGDYLIAEEHAATAAVETVISLLAGSLDQPRSGTFVVVTAAEGDSHSLGARAVAAFLLYLGYRTSFLGANTVASDLREYLEVEPPDAVVLSCAMTNHLLGARAAIRAAHSLEVPVLAGGRGFGQSGEWAGRVGADAWANSPWDVEQILSSWTPNPTEAESGAVDPSEELVRMVELRAHITGQAQRELSNRTDIREARLATEVGLLLGTVEAAMLVGSRQPIADMLEWQHASLTAHGLDVADDIARSVLAALDDVAPPAGELLAGALDGR